MDRVQRAELIAAIARDASSSEDLETILRRSLDRLREAVRFKGGSIAFAQEDGWLAIAVAVGVIDAEALAVRARPGEGIVGTVFATGHSFRSGDLDREARVRPTNRDTGTNRLMRSFLCVPLLSRGEVFGTLEIDSAEADAFDAEDQELVETIGAVLGGLVRLARLVERERAVIAARDDFFAAVAHDLRNPLTVIRAQAQRLRRRRLAEDDDRLVAAIEGQSVRLERLIAGLLDVARARSGDPVPAVRVTCDLAPAVERSARDALGPEHAARLRLELAETRGEFDPRRVEQIVTNLVGNADRYAPDGPIEVSTRRDGDGAVLRVADHGPGIPLELRDRIFDRWQRGGAADAGGSGLGLHIVRLAAEAHAGSVTARGRDDGMPGAVFEVRLPLAAGKDRGARLQRSGAE